MINIHDLNEDRIIHPDLIADLKENKNYTHLKPIFFAACSSNDLDLIKYCLTSTDLANYDNLDEYIENGFEQALNSESMDTISYFIFDLNLVKNETVEHILKTSERTESYLRKIVKNKNNNDSFIDKVINMFKIRDINQNLESELPINEESLNKKLKL